MAEGNGPAPPADRGAAGLAQLVEHVICNHGVGGSNPSAGTNDIKGSRLISGIGGPELGLA